MDNTFRRQLTLAACLIGAIVIGWQLAQGNSTFLVLGLLLGLTALIQRAHKVHPEAIIISVLFIGYIVGNRGFAQFNVGGIFIGELAMVALLALGLMHIGTIKKIPYHIDFIGLAIIAFIALATLRLPIDFQRHGFNALRDYATCYYAVFYFLIQPILNDKRSLTLIERALMVAVIFLIPLYVLFDRFTDYFLSNFLINDVPLFYYKYDLVACFLGCGFFLFYFKLITQNKVPYAILAALSFLLMLSTTSRAALPGFLIGFTLFFLAGMRSIPRFLTLTILIAVIPFTYFLIATEKDLSESKAFAIIEHAISVIDLSGTYNYQNPEASNSGDNNRYRIEWWKNVIDETIKEGPILGLGFGHDLTNRFLDDYYGDTEMNFSVRSPHSIFLTVFGRMGFAGLALFLIIIALIAKATLNALLQSRNTQQLHPSLPYYAIVWMIIGSAAFGVVLEGPMGAIPFWTTLAIARHQL